MFRTILIVTLSANVINYRKKLYWTSCICFQGLTLKQVATTKRLFRPDILSRQRSSNLSEIGWIWHLRCSMEEFTLTDGDFQILTVTPRVSKKIMGHNDNSSWIVVMLTSGIDYPSALPAARTLPKLWDKQHTGELIALDKVKSVPKFFIYWAWRPNTDAVLVPLPSMPWRPQAPGMMGSGLWTSHQHFNGYIGNLDYILAIIYPS